MIGLKQDIVETMAEGNKQGKDILSIKVIADIKVPNGVERRQYTKFSDIPDDVQVDDTRDTVRGCVLFKDSFMIMEEVDGVYFGWRFIPYLPTVEVLPSLDWDKLSPWSI